MKKVLCLHGFQTSGSILRTQTAFLRRILGDKYEWIFPNAPFRSKEIPPKEVTTYFSPPYFEWHNDYHGFQTSKQYLQNLYDKEDVNIILGFSQGAAMATALALDNNPDKVLLFGGVPPRSKQLVETPSIHVIGKTDPIRHRSEMLADQYLNPQIIYHNGGHRFPSERKAYTEILNVF